MKKILFVLVLFALVLTACQPQEAPAAEVVQPGVSHEEFQALSDNVGALTDNLDHLAARLADYLDAEAAAAVEEAVEDAVEDAGETKGGLSADVPVCPDPSVARTVALVGTDYERKFFPAQQIVDADGDAVFVGGKMKLRYMTADRIDPLYASDIVCVGQHYLVAGGYNVFHVVAGFRFDEETETWSEWEIPDFNIFVQGTILDQLFE